LSKASKVRDPHGHKLNAEVARVSHGLKDPCCFGWTAVPRHRRKSCASVRQRSSVVTESRAGSAPRDVFRWEPFPGSWPCVER
jgi:hypothetical protein